MLSFLVSHFPLQPYSEITSIHYDKRQHIGRNLLFHPCTKAGKNMCTVKCTAKLSNCWKSQYLEQPEQSQLSYKEKPLETLPTSRHVFSACLQQVFSHAPHFQKKIRA